MKMKKLLPILALVLLLAWYLLPDMGGAVLPTAAAQASPAAELSLVTPAPTKTPKPTATPKPTKAPAPSPAASESPEEKTLDEDGSYTSKEDVALYIHTYGRRQLLRQLRGAAPQGQGAQVDGVRHQHPRREIPRGRAHRLLQRRADLLHLRPLREL